MAQILRFRSHVGLGIEVDIAPLPNIFTNHELCNEVSLEICVIPVGLAPTDHLENYKAQLDIVKTLKPDGWSIDQAVEFFTATLAINAELGLQGMVSHEMHKNRAFFTLHATAARLLDQGDDDKDLLRTIIPRKQAIQSIIHRRSSPITFVLEYGPFPYHPFGAAARFSDVADSEGRRLQTLFETFAYEASSS
ncbi:hypothetical protein BDV39DRAFT_196972 [Aspergillus sergii]|uniref:Uncharacterized protein n=1 Tax=Aspergillus sergii TaxID=1034303 RepID=A0A5N6WNE0_9EURO|nr:hypothetical protein BDV39DRAFT_196972 [Aspergillus sergii]